MKIAIDSGPLAGASKGRGIGVYTRLLSQELSTIGPNQDAFVEVVDVKAEQNIQRFDLIHYPAFDFFYPTLPLAHKVPFVVTIHDTIPLLFPSHYPPGVKGSINLQRQKLALRRAAAVITDSFTSQKDIVRTLPVNHKKVYPVYLGPTIDLESPISKTVLKKYHINWPYIIYVGDVNWNKNLVNLAAVCEELKLHLVIVGKRAVDTNFDQKHIENKPLVELQSRFGESAFVHRVGYLSDSELPSLIKESILLCQPSFYEGFGLSVLDAMVLGVPTVCAKTQTLVEVYGDGSIFFDLNDRNDMVQVLTRVVDSESIRKDLSKKGISLAKRFSWQKTATETIDVYKRALQK